MPELVSKCKTCKFRTSITETNLQDSYGNPSAMLNRDGVNVGPVLPYHFCNKYNWMLITLVGSTDPDVVECIGYEEVGK